MSEQEKGIIEKAVEDGAISAPICATERVEIKEYEPVKGKLHVGIVGDGRGLVSKHMFVDETLKEMQKVNEELEKQRLPEGFIRGQIVNSLEGYKPGYKPVEYKLNEDGAPEPAVPCVATIMDGSISKNKRFYPAETIQKASQMMVLTDDERVGDQSVVGSIVHMMKEVEMIQFPPYGASNPYKTALESVPESVVDHMTENISQYIERDRELYVSEGISAKTKFEDGNPVFIPKTPDRLTTLQRYCWENVNRMYGSIGTDYTVTGTSKKSRPLWFLQPARGNGRSLQEYKRFVEYMTGIRNNDEGIESFIKDITIHNLNVDCASPSYYGSYWKNLMYITDVKLSGNIPLMIATYQNRAGYKYPSVSRYPHTIKKVKLNITTKKRGRLR